jgi:hypothetical protein
MTARRWQLAHGRDAIEWIRSSGTAQRMLEDICAAVETTVDWVVGNDPETARRVLRQFPQVWRPHDDLEFSDPTQALAYLILHLPDRYTRTFQVLECLLSSGRLPLGKGDNFAAIDIGAGPGPGIFAIRSFYAALAHYVSLHDPSWTVATVGSTDVVERSQGMPRVMHRFAEALVTIEQGRPTAPGSDHGTPNPCAAELRHSAAPFGADYVDFTALDVKQEHERARRSLAEEQYREDSLELTRADANRPAYAESAGRPSSYALAVLMYFLTTTDVVSMFSDAIERLVHGSLVPGGTILMFGADGGDWQDVYTELDGRAQAAYLTVLDSFDKPLQAGHRADERATIRTLTRGIWKRLEPLAGDVSQIKEELRERRADKIFDESTSFGFPQFRVRAYLVAGKPLCEVI